jgi:hypothetical protein
LFKYWYNSNFAQDEIQTAEHPDLARIAVDLDYPSCWQKPCLISNAKRACAINGLSEIYGWKFSDSPLDALKKHVVPFDTNSMTKTNILVMAALQISGNQTCKQYSVMDIVTLFKTSYSAFRLVVLAKKKFKKIIVNTGNWGCGSFGNNYRLIAIIQILAACLAGLNELNYYTFDEHAHLEYHKAKEWIVHNIELTKVKTVGDVVSIIHGGNFIYGESNGT